VNYYQRKKREKQLIALALFLFVCLYIGSELFIHYYLGPEP